jgi:hypothetical protein
MVDQVGDRPKRQPLARGATHGGGDDGEQLVQGDGQCKMKEYQRRKEAQSRVGITLVLRCRNGKGEGLGMRPGVETRLGENKELSQFFEHVRPTINLGSCAKKDIIDVLSLARALAR